MNSEGVFSGRLQMILQDDDALFVQRIIDHVHAKADLL